MRLKASSFFLHILLLLHNLCSSSCCGSGGYVGGVDEMRLWTSWIVSSKVFVVLLLRLHPTLGCTQLLVASMKVARSPPRQRSLMAVTERATQLSEEMGARSQLDDRLRLACSELIPQLQRRVA